MVFAHMPAGYLLTRFMSGRFGVRAPEATRLLMVGLAASVLPDMDLLYSFFLDLDQNGHHNMWPHLPLAWVAITLVAYALARLRDGELWRQAVLVFGANVMLHLVLDSLVGGIHWLYPFSDQLYRMTRVVPYYKWWLLNHIVHWTFIFEILIVLAAGAVFGMDMLRRRPPAELGAKLERDDICG